LFGLERTLGARLVTYADDLVILCRRGKAEAALQRLREIMGKLKLTVNEEKTRICKVPEGEFDFLGYTFGRMFSARTGHSGIAAEAFPDLVRAPERSDEHGWDPKGPPTLIDLRANLDASGSVTAWESEFFIPQGAATDVDLIAATLANMPAEHLLSPGGILNDSAIGYKFPNIKTVCHRLETTPLRPAWIRAPGRLQNTFANECFIDEIAAAVEEDPLNFRVIYTDPSDRRGLAVLDRLANLAKWDKRASPQKSIAGNVVKGRVQLR